MKRTVAEEAARWWADRIRKVQYSEEIDIFERELTELILERMREEPLVILGVDWVPDQIFKDAADKASLRLGMTDLPWQTVMRIEKGHIEVALGYGSDYEALS